MILNMFMTFIATCSILITLSVLFLKQCDELCCTNLTFFRRYFVKVSILEGRYTEYICPECWHWQSANDDGIDFEVCCNSRCEYLNVPHDDKFCYHKEIDNWHLRCLLYGDCKIKGKKRDSHCPVPKNCPFYNVHLVCGCNKPTICDKSCFGKETIRGKATRIRI